MKIEKLTENKIRVIVNLEDLLKKNIHINTDLMSTSNFQNLFFDILKKAENETGFYTKGCKLFIEIFSFSDEIVVFTITKYSSIDLKESNHEIKKKKLIAKRKTFNIKNQDAIYIFKDFDIFCNFCNSLKNLDTKKLYKNSILYLYKDIYYLIVKNINNNYINSNIFFSAISEFAKLSTFSINFENKLLEHGKTIIKKDAIGIGIKYFNKI